MLKFLTTCGIYFIYVIVWFIESSLWHLTVDLFKHHQVRPQPCSETWSINNTLQVFWVFCFVLLFKARRPHPRNWYECGGWLCLRWPHPGNWNGYWSRPVPIPVTPTRGIGTGAEVGWVTVGTSTCAGTNGALAALATGTGMGWPLATLEARTGIGEGSGVTWEWT